MTTTFIGKEKGIPNEQSQECIFGYPIRKHIWFSK
jgi:hypothetical protein